MATQKRNSHVGGNDRLVSLRTRAGLSQKELARQAGVSASTLFRLESNRTYLARQDTLGKLALVLGVGIEELFGRPGVNDLLPEDQLRDRVLEAALAAETTATSLLAETGPWGTHEGIATIALFSTRMVAGMVTMMERDDSSAEANNQPEIAAGVLKMVFEIADGLLKEVFADSDELATNGADRVTQD